MASNTGCYHGVRSNCRHKFRLEMWNVPWSVLAAIRLTGPPVYSSLMVMISSIILETIVILLVLYHDIGKTNIFVSEDLVGLATHSLIPRSFQSTEDPGKCSCNTRLLCDIQNNRRSIVSSIIVPHRCGSWLCDMHPFSVAEQRIPLVKSGRYVINQSIQKWREVDGPACT